MSRIYYHNPVRFWLKAKTAASVRIVCSQYLWERSMINCNAQQVAKSSQARRWAQVRRKAARASLIRLGYPL